MTHETKQFLEAIDFAHKSEHKTLNWHGKVPEEILQLAGIRGGTSARYFTIFGIRVETQPLYSTKK